MRSDVGEKLKEAKRLSMLVIVLRVVLDFVSLGLVSCLLYSISLNFSLFISSVSIYIDNIYVLSLGFHQQFVTYFYLSIMKTAPKLSALAYILNSTPSNLLPSTTSKLLFASSPKVMVPPTTKIVVAKASMPITAKAASATKVGSLGLLGVTFNGLFRAVRLGIAGVLGMMIGYFVNLYKKAGQVAEIAVNKLWIVVPHIVGMGVVAWLSKHRKLVLKSGRGAILSYLMATNYVTVYAIYRILLGLEIKQNPVIVKYGLNDEVNNGQEQPDTPF